ncbi:MAG: hypothetical protein M3032_10900, partial [Verrucomicrobiota bacterium]|nr:hypothetical protein [Verrucomicrobiota bacterium]
INGPASFNTANGARDIALVGDSSISTSVASAFTWDLSGIHSLTLATSGGLSIGNVNFLATAGSGFDRLAFYQRSATGALSYNGQINIPTATLMVDAPANVTFGGTGAVNVDKAVINSGQNINLNGSFSANLLQLYAQTSIQFKSKPTPVGFLFAYAPNLTSTTDIGASYGGDLVIGTGGIDARDNNISGLDNVISDGDMYVGDVTVKNRFYVGGVAQSRGWMAHTFSAWTIEAPLGFRFVPGSNTSGGTLTLNANSLLFDSATGGINGVTVDGGDASLLGLAGGDGGTLSLGSATTPIPGDVTVNVPISATTGGNTLGLLTGGTGGGVFVTSNGTVAVNSSIKVSDSVQPRASNAGGAINIASKKTTGTAISVSSSGQLLSLLSNAAPGPGGTIKLTSAGGAINVNGTVRADRGTVDIQNNGPSGAINLTNATLNAGTVKATALGANGTLNVGGGTINADTLISLYAGGSNGSVNFNENVTLSGNSAKHIQGNTVTVVNGKTVNVQGPAPANVYTNNPNYSGSGGNGSTTGTFGGKGATTAPLSAGPGPGG